MFGAAHDDAIVQIIQDGDRRHLLCHDCEQKLSAWEREFRNVFLAPFSRRDGLTDSLRALGVEIWHIGAVANSVCGS